MEQLPDFYAVLGVDVNAPPDVLKKAFKHLALQYHPDVYPEGKNGVDVLGWSEIEAMRHFTLYSRVEKDAV